MKTCFILSSLAIKGIFVFRVQEIIAYVMFTLREKLSFGSWIDNKLLNPEFAAFIDHRRFLCQLEPVYCWSITVNSRLAEEFEVTRGVTRRYRAHCDEACPLSNHYYYSSSCVQVPNLVQIDDWSHQSTDGVRMLTTKICSCQTLRSMIARQWENSKYGHLLINLYWEESIFAVLLNSKIITFEFNSTETGLQIFELSAD